MTTGAKTSTKLGGVPRPLPAAPTNPAPASAPPLATGGPVPGPAAPLLPDASAVLPGEAIIPTAPTAGFGGQGCTIDAPLEANAGDDGKTAAACAQRFDNTPTLPPAPRLALPRVRVELHEGIGRLVLDPPFRSLAEAGRRVTFAPLAFVSLADGVAFAGVLTDPQALGSPECVVAFTGRDRPVGEAMVDASLLPGDDGQPIPLWRQRFSLRARRRFIRGEDVVFLDAEALPSADAAGDDTAARRAAALVDNLALEAGAAPVAAGPSG